MCLASVVGCGFRSGKLRTNKCFPICPRKRTSTDGTGMSALCQEATYALQQIAIYSITSSARSRNDSGIVSPSILAVLRLITS